MSAEGEGLKQEQVRGGGRHRWLALFLALALVRGLIYAYVVPPWQAPDEWGHFEYVWLITHLGRLPTPQDLSVDFERELVGSFYEWDYDRFHRVLPREMPTRLGEIPWTTSRTVLAERSSLAYVWSALFLFPLRYGDLVLQLYAARLSSVILNVVIVWLAWRVFAELLPSRPDLVSMMMAVVVFLPQHTFINSMVGEGPLAELMSCLVLWGWVRLFRHGFGGWEIVAITLGTLVGISSKNTAIFLLPLNGGLALWWILRRGLAGWVWRRWMFLLVIGIIVGVGFAVWSQSTLGIRALSWENWLRLPSELAWVDYQGVTVLEALLFTHDSFWAIFGWMNLPVDSRWYGSLLLGFLIALVGWAWTVSNKRRLAWMQAMMSGALLTALGIYVWVAILAKRSGGYQNQGRYLFPVLIPYTYLLVGGLDRLCAPRLWPRVTVLLLFCLICFDSVCLARYILPFYYA